MDEVREGRLPARGAGACGVEEVAATANEEQLRELRRNLRLQEALVADGDAGGLLCRRRAVPRNGAGLHRATAGLPGLSRTAWVHVDPARRLLLPSRGGLRRRLRSTRQFSPLEAHDPDGARAALRGHLRQMVTRLERLAEERPELFS
jgi:DNA-binding GntR family transcriptional regulator